MGTTSKHVGPGGRIKAAVHSELATGATQNIEIVPGVTVTMTAASAVSITNIIPEAQVGAGRTFYLQGYLIRVNGTDSWPTAATFKIQDTNGTPVDFATVSAVTTTFTSGTRIGPWTSGQVLEDAFSLGTGGTAGKGVQVVASATQTATASPLAVTVWGFIKG